MRARARRVMAGNLARRKGGGKRARGLRPGGEVGGSARPRHWSERPCRRQPPSTGCSDQWRNRRPPGVRGPRASDTSGRSCCCVALLSRAAVPVPIHRVEDRAVVAGDGPQRGAGHGGARFPGLFGTPRMRGARRASISRSSVVNSPQKVPCTPATRGAISSAPQGLATSSASPQGRRRRPRRRPSRRHWRCGPCRDRHAGRGTSPRHGPCGRRRCRGLGRSRKRGVRRGQCRRCRPWPLPPTRRGGCRGRSGGRRLSPSSSLAGRRGSSAPRAP